MDYASKYRCNAGICAGYFSGDVVSGETLLAELGETGLAHVVKHGGFVPLPEEEPTEAPVEEPVEVIPQSTDIEDQDDAEDQSDTDPADAVPVSPPDTSPDDEPKPKKKPKPADGGE